MSEKQDDPLRQFILSSLADGSARTPQDLARAFHAGRSKPDDGPTAWKRYLLAAKQQCLSLARAERLIFLRKGMPIHPGDVKGLYQVRLPLAGEAFPQPKPRDLDDDDEAADPDGDDEAD
jgi:hypothetical protein